MAIRFGAVDAKTFDELCTKTLPKTVPLVDWVHPLRPVFPQSSTSCEVQLDKPSTRGSTSWAIENFTAAVGLKERFKPHDLRHGAGVDVNNSQDVPVRNEFHDHCLRYTIATLILVLVLVSVVILVLVRRYLSSFLLLSLFSSLSSFSSLDIHCVDGAYIYLCAIHAVSGFRPFRRIVRVIIIENH
ncbi:hypothetical protein GCG54_00001996 [Colletotrichum gloeosporioides]|uniref:Uncharacterized protein n=1 Tax=Colletotrichum gloeosporioides TaxID=474922 RepID=A0A8H4FLE2_COLGL|nr:uncharacterized protein GCG54_00001996 [Colletotrichum gloeosporioides]KAF3805219.1 hypothetical protein GCG54_00001996 [Colletotrichum gloeosporioides]